MTPTRLRDLRRRHVAMVFQGAALFDSLSVGENIAYPLREHFKEMTPAQVRELAAALDAAPGLTPVDHSQWPSA